MNFRTPDWLLYAMAALSLTIAGLVLGHALARLKRTFAMRTVARSARGLRSPSFCIQPVLPKITEFPRDHHPVDRATGGHRTNLPMDGLTL